MKRAAALAALLAGGAAAKEEEDSDEQALRVEAGAGLDEKLDALFTGYATPLDADEHERRGDVVVDTDGL